MNRKNRVIKNESFLLYENLAMRFGHVAKLNWEPSIVSNKSEPKFCANGPLNIPKFTGEQNEIKFAIAEKSSMKNQSEMEKVGRLVEADSHCWRSTIVGETVLMDTGLQDDVGWLGTTESHLRCVFDWPLSLSLSLTHSSIFFPFLLT